MNLMQMSFSGAAMILVIVVFRALALNKLPKKIFFVLWGVVAARLLVPYSFPSAFSIYSVLGRLTATEETVNGSLAVSFLPVASTQNVMPAPVAATYTAAAVDPWVIVWAAGALICAVFFAVAYLKCHREFRLSLPVDNEYVKVWLGEHRIYRAIEIRRSDRISAPLTYGVFRPVILMPKTTDWNDLETLKYVLAHEYVHIRRFDVVSKLVLTIVLCVHWFNPAVWLMYVLANRDIELSCDEAVICRFGERTKSAYAMTLIRMEETKSELNPLCNNFSKNAIEERIVAIMKMKKTSLAALIGAAAFVFGVTTVFATSAKDDGNVQQGTDYVSDTPDVEWWTYDEYKTWLEKEKVELQELIGEKCWTGSRGEFVWTQEIVDETIAMYEDILENIKNGMLYSKTIDGEEDSLTLSSGSAAGEAEIYEGDAAASDFSRYEPFGLVWDEDKKALFWNGERVRYFLDGVDVDGTGAMAIRLEYTDADLAGNIDVHTVRQRVSNADGSFDPMGPLTGLEKYSQEEYDRNTLRIDTARDTAQKAESIASEDTSAGSAVSEDTSEGIIDSEATLAGTAVSDVILTETVKAENTIEEISVAEGDATAPGTDFAKIFEKYAPFGITYEETKDSSGMGNVYYNGQLVRQFSDLTPDGGVFTFSSAKQGNFAVKTVYDENGRLIGVESVGGY